MPSTISCAYLRIYRSPDALEPSEQDALRGRRRVREDGPLGLLAQEEAASFFTRRVDGELVVCPARMPLRRLWSLVTASATLPHAAARALLDPDEVAAARTRLAVLSTRSPAMRPWLIQSAWTVPAHWFVCFDDSERVFQEDGDRSVVRYFTSRSQAVARLELASSGVPGGIHPSIASPIMELRAWLAQFEDGFVELDYASVARLFDAEALADDRSAADLWEAIHAIRDGDRGRAGRAYRRMSRRWSPMRARERVN